MGSCSGCREHELTFVDTVDEKPIGLDMAFAMPFEVSRKCMVVKVFGKALLGAKETKCVFELFEVAPLLLRTLVIFLEFCRVGKLKHGLIFVERYEHVVNGIEGADDSSRYGIIHGGKGLGGKSVGIG